MSSFHWLLCPVCHVLIGSLCSLISGVSFYVISHIYILFFLLFGEPCPGLCSVMFIVKPSSSHHLVLFMSILFNKLHLDSQLYSLYLYISLSYIMLTTKICPFALKCTDKHHNNTVGTTESHEDSGFTVSCS